MSRKEIMGIVSLIFPGDNFAPISNPGILDRSLFTAHSSLLATVVGAFYPSPFSARQKLNRIPGLKE